MKTELLRQKHKQKENKIKEEDEREERQRHIRKPIGEGWFRPQVSQSLPKMVKMVGLDLLIFETFVVLVISYLVP